MPVQHYDAASPELARIASELRKATAGIWLAELARRTSIPAPTLHYLIFGRPGLRRRYGGYLAANVRKEQQGRNLILKWKN